MTNYFAYENLTWPEVDALPRNTPLVLPLGEGYSLDRLTSALSNPPVVGLLPSFPYGWRGSGLSVPEEELSRILRNLIDSLRDDGFSQVYALTPQGIDLELGDLKITLPHPSQYSAERPVPGDPDLAKVVIIPIGHTEQHGYHLPLSTDTLIIDAIAHETARQRPDQAISLPVMPYGVSTHRAAFAGTMNCGGRAFEDFYQVVIDVLASRGVNRIYMLSGHGGNSSFLVNIIKYAGERHRRTFYATSWLYLSGPKGIAALERSRQSPIGGMGHACELETSLILYLRPDLVRMDLAVDELDFVTTPAYYMDWVEGGSLIANPPWDDDTQTGAYGAGSLGTVEKGRLWFEAAVAEKIDHIGEIHDQYKLRTIRRENGYGLWGKFKDYK